MTRKQSEQLQENNNNCNSQHIHNKIDVHDLTNLMLQNERVAEANQLPSSIAVFSCPCVNDYILDIMSIDEAKRIASESPICVGGDEATSTSNRASESIIHYDIPDQSQSESGLVNMYVLTNIIQVNVNEKITISSKQDHVYIMVTQSEVASPEEDEGLNTPNDTDGNDTCENGGKNCLSTCYYCRWFL